MAAGFVASRHTIEQEWVDIVVKRLVVEEELAQETQVPAPGALATAVDFKEGDIVVAVNLITRWVGQGAFCAMALESTLVVKIAQAELVDVD